MTRRSASGRNSASTLCLVALGDAQVVVVGDALLGQADAQLVEHDLDLALDQQVGQLERGIGHGELDDPVGEDVARAIQRVALQPAPDLRPQRVEVLVLRPTSATKSSSSSGSRLVAQLEQRDLELGRLAGQLRLRVVVAGR